MKKIILFVFIFSVIVSGCSKSFDGVIVGKVAENYSVDVKIDGGEVRTVYLTKEEFYSGSFEVGTEIDFSCIVYNCLPK